MIASVKMEEKDECYSALSTHIGTLDRFKMQTAPGLNALCDAIAATRNTTTIQIVNMSNSTKIKYVLPDGEHEHLVVNKRLCGKKFSFYVYFPAGLTRSQHRYIYFKNKYGVGTSFKKFVLMQLKKVICEWESSTAAKLWCQNNLGGLKTKIETAWDSRLQLTSRKRPRSTNDENKYVRSPRGSTTISIPIHGLVSKGEVPVIRIRQARNSSNAPFLRMTIPGVIFSDQRTRTKSLRTRFGHDRKWSYFVKTHVEAQASSWKTLDDAQNWALATDSVDTMNGIWAMLLRNDLVTYARTNS